MQNQLYLFTSTRRQAKATWISQVFLSVVKCTDFSRTKRNFCIRNWYNIFLHNIMISENSFQMWEYSCFVANTDLKIEFLNKQNQAIKSTERQHIVYSFINELNITILWQQKTQWWQTDVYIKPGTVYLNNLYMCVSTPVSARSKMWVYGRSLAGIVGLNPAGGMDVCLLWVLSVVR
jgi:hypothetical protein